MVSARKDFTQSFDQICKDPQTGCKLIISHLPLDASVHIRKPRVNTVHAFVGDATPRRRRIPLPNVRLDARSFAVPEKFQNLYPISVR